MIYQWKIIQKSERGTPLFCFFCWFSILQFMACLKIARTLSLWPYYILLILTLWRTKRKKNLNNPQKKNSTAPQKWTPTEASSKQPSQSHQHHLSTKRALPCSSQPAITWWVPSLSTPKYQLKKWDPTRNHSTERTTGTCRWCRCWMRVSESCRLWHRAR